MSVLILHKTERLVRADQEGKKIYVKSQIIRRWAVE